MNTLETLEQRIDTFPLRVEPFQVDFNSRIFMGVLCNAMLNAAGMHSHNRGWGIPDLMKTNHTWVLSRFSVEFSRMPQWGDTVSIATWVHSAMRLFTNRRFRITDQDGIPVAYCRSVWAMINFVTRKPQDLLALNDGELLSWCVSDEEMPCPIDDFRAIHMRGGELVRRVPTFYSDVDINGHINSVKYIEHIVNLLSNEQLTRGIRRLDVAYKNECHQGDELQMYAQPENADTLLVEVRREDGQVAVQARVVLNSTKNENNEKAK